MLVNSRSFVVSIVLAAAVSSAVAIGAQTRGQVATEQPVRPSAQSITGAFEGWYQNPDGTFSLLMGYFNRNSGETLEIPVGPNNRIEPGPADQGQPTTFLPRRQWGVFRIVVPRDFGTKKLTWTIVANGQTTSIPMSLNPLWVVEPLKDAGNGNTPPVLKFEPNGAVLDGPTAGNRANPGGKGRGTARSDTMGVRRQAAAGRSRRTGGSVFWSKFRGPGEVTFENARPAPDPEGKATTTAKFAAPGEYILRAQANDTTGDGGGGFQCCWTNAHVKVTVTP